MSKKRGKGDEQRQWGLLGTELASIAPQVLVSVAAPRRCSLVPSERLHFHIQQQRKQETVSQTSFMVSSCSMLELGEGMSLFL